MPPAAGASLAWCFGARRLQGVAVPGAAMLGSMLNYMPTPAVSEFFGCCLSPPPPFLILFFSDQMHEPPFLWPVCFSGKTSSSTHLNAFGPDSFRPGPANSPARVTAYKSSNGQGNGSALEVPINFPLAVALLL